MAAPRLTAFTLLLLLLWAVQIPILLIFPNHSGRNLYAALVKGLELFFYLNLKDRTLPYSRTLRGALPCPHFLFFKGVAEMSPPPANSLSSEFYWTGRSSPPVCFILATYPKVSSPRAPRWRQRNQPACWGGAAFLFHNKTWTIIPTLGSLRVYVHPWLGTVSFRFLPCSRYQNSRKCVHTLQTYLTRNPFSRTNTTPTHTQEHPFLHIHTRPE